MVHPQVLTSFRFPIASGKWVWLAFLETSLNACSVGQRKPELAASLWHQLGTQPSSQFVNHAADDRESNQLRWGRCLDRFVVGEKVTKMAQSTRFHRMAVITNPESGFEVVGTFSADVDSRRITTEPYCIANEVVPYLLEPTVNALRHG